MEEHDGRAPAGVDVVDPLAFDVDERARYIAPYRGQRPRACRAAERRRALSPAAAAAPTASVPSSRFGRCMIVAILTRSVAYCDSVGRSASVTSTDFFAPSR